MHSPTNTIFMSQRNPRRRSLLIGGRRPPRPRPKILKRCSSAPLLFSRARDYDDDFDDHFGRSRETIFHHRISLDAFLSSPSLFPSSPYSHSNNQIKGYNKEAKVVVNVTVEGSPGPIRTMVKLGSSVEDTIKRVIDRYREEGRSPKLDPNPSSFFQLHDSHFSLQSLDKSDVIGDVGSRSFYLRKNGSLSSLNSFHSESGPCIAAPPLLPSSFIARKINKIVRRAQRLWNIVICSQ
ncbi:PREDICTED: uncharacterized protein At4g22758 isoform X2 [Lupinus angustifolius]|uniref:uncharacterized protein At4g22758 isoform X2 n=1 Tax=Lupinus angustifolius TaxID=3871 RepID=UPI00092E64F2|nr:PREDICTED: uncharacterized protein At4g22758 isoform X2 [Lupinus angustifolius]